MQKSDTFKQIICSILILLSFLLGFKLKNYANYMSSDSNKDEDKQQELETRFQIEAPTRAGLIKRLDNKLEYLATTTTTRSIKTDNHFGLKLFRPKYEFSNEAIEKLIESANYTKSILLIDSTNGADFVIEPKGKSYFECDNDNNNADSLTLLIVVNSKWNNFNRRKRLRSSWLNRNNLNEQICNISRYNNNNNNLLGAPSIGRVQYLFAVGKSNNNIYEEESFSDKLSSNSNSNSSDNINKSNRNNDLSMMKISLESKVNQDILVLNLLESYKSMSFKHLKLIKWILLRWSMKGKDFNLNKTLILKCDDDALVNIRQIINFYNEQIKITAYSHSILNDENENENKKFSILFNEKSSSSPIILDTNNIEEFSSSLSLIKNNLKSPIRVNSNWFMCATFPENTLVLRKQKIKWRLTKREYNYDTFPSYCSGLAYLAPIKLLQRLYVIAQELMLRPDKDIARPLWVDDVFITGIVAASLKDRITYIHMNNRFCYNQNDITNRAIFGSPCMVTELNK